MTFSDLPLLTGAISALALFLLSKYIYRVTFHPLAAFPGPRLAALTSLYGASYDLHPNRSYCKQLAALHEIYGPIVRIWPNQLHIRDIDTYHEIFKTGTKFDRDGPFYSNPTLEGSYFSIASTKSALARKNMHAPLFSKEAVRRSEHLITDILAKFLEILSHHASESRSVDLSLGFSCLAADISMNYAFQRPINALDAEAFQSEVIIAADSLLEMYQWPIYFPNFFAGVMWVTACLPKWALNRLKLMKSLALVNWCLEISREQITHLQKRSPSEGDIRTVFDINLHPNLEKGQFTPTINEMAADAYVLLNAGTDTVSLTLVVITWALLNDPQMLQRLKADLRTVMMSRDDTIDWATLEKLAYLGAVVKEGLRLTYGNPGPVPRVVPSSGAVFCGQEIPAGTLVSSCTYVYHQDPHTFKDPNIFRPERWLSDPTSNLREMENKFIPFSRGSRACIGINVAYAELHLVLAHLVRRFDILNDGTSDKDMDWDDYIVPMKKGHLKVIMRENVD